MPTNHLQATVNDEFSFESDQLADTDLRVQPDGSFHLLQNGQSIRAELVTVDYKAKTFGILINGNHYTVRLSTALEQMIDRLGLGKMATHAAADIKAPMPGLVREVLVSEGQAIATGEPVLILEAMKMENVIKAGGDGTVSAIHVKAGAAVEKGELMIAVS